MRNRANWYSSGGWPKYRPVHEPNAAAVEEDIFRLQVHVGRHQIGVETRVSGTDLIVAAENLLDLIVREQAGAAKSPDEPLVRGNVVKRLRKRRQSMETPQRLGKKDQCLRGREGNGFDELGDRDPIFRVGV